MKFEYSHRLPYKEIEYTIAASAYTAVAVYLHSNPPARVNDGTKVSSPGTGGRTGERSLCSTVNFFQLISISLEMV